jgi:hypothetical protein
MASFWSIIRCKGKKKVDTKRILTPTNQSITQTYLFFIISVR